MEQITYGKLRFIFAALFDGSNKWPQRVHHMNSRAPEVDLKFLLPSLLAGMVLLLPFNILIHPHTTRTGRHLQINMCMAAIMVATALPVPRVLTHPRCTVAQFPHLTPTCILFPRTPFSSPWATLLFYPFSILWCPVPATLTLTL